MDTSKATAGPDLVFANARVVTLDHRRPLADLVATTGDRIARVGRSADLPALRSSGARVIDCGGGTLVPGFIDAHCHLFAYAASLLDVDCGPSAVTSIPEVASALARRAAGTPEGWVRGRGYDELALEERRHPSRRDLDPMLPDRPVKLSHRSGHACVLNSAALRQAGISRDTPDPAGGVIDRDPATGEPTGLLLEMEDYLEGIFPPRSQAEFQRGVELAGSRLLSLGITSVHDATHLNSPERWDTFVALKAGGWLVPRVTAMVGAGQLGEFLGRGLRFGAGDADLNVGAVKIMVTVTTGSLVPSPEELAEGVRAAHRAGFPVAVHAVEAEAVQAAAEALTRPRVPAELPGPDRIEHCSECSPDVLGILRGSNVAVVTQPGFIYYSGDRYLSEVPEAVRPWLYRLGTLMEEGLRPAAGSDSPVIEPNPMVGIYAAVARRSASGRVVGPSERISAGAALAVYTLNAAYASGHEADKGSIEVGKLADLTLLDGDPTRVDPERIRHIRPTMTVVGGRVVWRG